MKAAVLRAFGAPLELADVPEPRAGPGEVLVEVRAVGLCGTDLKIVGGQFATTPLPIVPGHEVAGVVVESSEEVPAGTRVACYLYDPCGECRWCAAGQDTLCPSSRRIGFERDGGLARLVRMKPRNLVPFGEALDFAAAAVAMDAVLSTWRALRVRAQVVRGERVVIAGAGGLGLNALQVAVRLGATVAVLDPVESHREAAIARGAELAVAPEGAAGILDWSGGGADVGLEASGTRNGFQLLAASLRPGARLVCNGYRPGVEYGLDSADLVLREITVLGSRNGSRADARDALRVVSEGAVTPLISERLPLEEVNQALDRLRSGEVLGRIVIQP